MLWKEIISVGKFSEVPEMMGHISPFENIRRLDLEDMPDLKSIYWKPLAFTHLKEMVVRICDQLKKLPLDSISAKERKFVIRGDIHWWRSLQWEDEATQIALLSCFAKFDFWIFTCVLIIVHRGLPTRKVCLLRRQSQWRKGIQ